MYAAIGRDVCEGSGEFYGGYETEQRARDNCPVCWTHNEEYVR